MKKNANSGWNSWLSQFNRAQCRAMALLPADYQQIMLTAAFLTGSLRKVDDDIGYSRVLLIGLGARSIANYIQYHLFWVRKYCFIKKDSFSFIKKKKKK